MMFERHIEVKKIRKAFHIYNAIFMGIAAFGFSAAVFGVAVSPPIVIGLTAICAFSYIKAAINYKVLRVEK